MKRYYVPTILVILFSLFTFSSCNDEQLEGEFFSTPDGSDPEEFCENALATIAEAQFALLDATEANAGELCQALRGSIEGVIAVCGDPGGSFQALLDELGDDCGLMFDNAECLSASLAAGLALDAFNIATPEEQEGLCPNLLTLLQEQIMACGDDDGSLQAIIDGLPCS